jgi:hypothetical protein
MVKTIWDPKQSALSLNPEPEPASSKLEETWEELVAADAAHKKYTTRKETLEHLRSSPPRVLPKDNKTWKAPPAFADGTSTVINKRRRRP